MHNNAVSFHAPAKQSLRKRVCQRWQLFLFLLIPVAWVLIFCYYPMMGVQIAFKNYLPREGIWGSAWVGLTHFVTFFKSFYFSRTVGNTVRLSLYSLGVGFPLAIIFALMMNLIRRRRFQKAVQTISYMPHFISTVVLVGMMNQILNPVTGLYSNIYRLFNPGEYPIDILPAPMPSITCMYGRASGKTWAGTPSSIWRRFPAWIPRCMRPRRWTALRACGAYGISICRCCCQPPPLC